MKKYNINPHILMTRLRRSIQFFHTERSILYSLEGSAVIFFELVTSGKDLEDITKILAVRYNCSTKIIKKDLRIFINQLIEAEIIYG